MKWYTVVNSAGSTWEIRANSEQDARDQAEQMIPYEQTLFNLDFEQDEDE